MAFTSLFTKVLVSGIRHYSSCINLNDSYIISAVRTPIGCFQGKLSSLSAVELGSKALVAAVERSNIPKEEVQEFLLGCAIHAGLGQGPARQIALFSGMPCSIITSTVNKLCGSGLKAVMFGCQIIQSNTQEVVAVGGAESLSNAPYFLRRKNMRIGNMCLPDIILHDTLIDMFEQVDVTAFAEQTAIEYYCTRDDQDDYALKSYSNAETAQKEGYFAAEMTPVILKKKGGRTSLRILVLFFRVLKISGFSIIEWMFNINKPVLSSDKCVLPLKFSDEEEEVISEDEEIKRLNVEKFKNLVPDMGKEGTITVGNSSGLNDGAACLIIASGNYVLKKNLQPLARIVSFADSAVDPRKFCIAPSVAIPRALVKANLVPDRISLWEISETFAVTAIVNTNILKLDPDRVNIHGGAISLGHPFGMTGVRLVVHLTHVLQRGEYGCAAISHASGGGSALIIEKM